jgi:hypothetical protein
VSGTCGGRKKKLAAGEKRKKAADLPAGQEREEAERILKHPEPHEARIKELKANQKL